MGQGDVFWRFYEDVMKQKDSEQLERIYALLKNEPTRRFSTKAIYAKVGNPGRITTLLLKNIREGMYPNLYGSRQGLHYEYFFLAEELFPVHKVLTYRELEDAGYLQEANRLFFHPLGLGLAITKEPAALIVYDFRDSPYGAAYAPGVTSSVEFQQRAESVAFETAARLLARQKALGFGVQDVSAPNTHRKSPRQARR